MNEREFWIILWGIGAVVSISIATMITIYWLAYDRKVTDMVLNGTPAIEAICALGNDRGANPSCVVVATQQAIKENK